MKDIVIEERMPYQRKNITFANDTIQELLWILWINWYSYPSEEITYGRFTNVWCYNPITDETWINFWYSFNTKVHVHELLHAFSGVRRHSPNQSEEFSLSWFHLHKRWSRKWQFFALNEWVTQLITHQVLSDNLDKVIKISNENEEERRRVIALYNHVSEKESEERKERISNINNRGTNTWWYPSYKREMSLANVLIDFITLIRLQGRLDYFTEEREKVWNELQLAYFTGDIKWLKSQLKLLDSKWLLYRHMMDLEPYKADIDSGIQDITDALKEHIQATLIHDYTEREVSQLL